MIFNDDSACVFPSCDKPRCSEEDRSTKVEPNQHFFLELNFQQTSSITAVLKCFVSPSAHQQLLLIPLG